MNALRLVAALSPNARCAAIAEVARIVSETF
jgi:hypothetical protein